MQWTPTVFNILMDSQLLSWLPLCYPGIAMGIPLTSVICSYPKTLISLICKCQIIWLLSYCYIHVQLSIRSQVITSSLRSKVTKFESISTVAWLESKLIGTGNSTSLSSIFTTKQTKLTTHSDYTAVLPYQMRSLDLHHYWQHLTVRQSVQ